MKRLTNIVILLFSVCALGQTSNQTMKWKNEILSDTNLYKKEYRASYTKYDFGSLWTHTDNSAVYGVIGENFQRIRIKILTSIKDTIHSDVYHISGKSMVKNNICQFKGTIKIISIRIYKHPHFGVDNELENVGFKKQGVLFAEYHFTEDSSQTHSGIFDGLLLSFWYIDINGKLKYDDIERHSDSYCNNQHVGTWTQYKSKISIVCKWGDYRVPLVKGLGFDIGAGEFSPDDKYLPFGWQSYRDAYFDNNAKARQEEQRLWWK